MKFELPEVSQVPVHPGGHPTYAPEESVFFNLLSLRSWDDAKSSKLPILEAGEGPEQRRPLCDVGPKYGVKAFVKELRTWRRDLHAHLKWATKLHYAKSKPVTMLTTLMRRIQQDFSLEIDVRQRQNGGRREFVVNRVYPATMKAIVFPSATALSKELKETGSLEGYHFENVFVPTEARYHITENTFEWWISTSVTCMTQHAMERLWARSDHRHNDYDAAIRELYRRVRAAAALMGFATSSTGAPPANYLAVPIFEGFAVLSVRKVGLQDTLNREGGRLTKRGPVEMKRRSEESFPYELHADEAPVVFKDMVFVATYMGASDVGDTRRIDAAREFASLLERPDIDELVVCMDQSTHAPIEPGTMPLKDFDPDRIIALQKLMLPRTDPRDERLYLLREYEW